jgi:hypothetical protein
MFYFHSCAAAGFRWKLQNGEMRLGCAIRLRRANRLARDFKAAQAIRAFARRGQPRRLAITISQPR